MLIIRPYDEADFDAVDHLWRACFPDDPPQNRANVAIPAKLALQRELFLVALSDDGEIIGTAMTGYDGHRGWLYTVAVDPKARRQGIGRALVDDALSRLRVLGCAKANLQIREGNEVVIAFYASLGFAVEPRTSMGMRLA